MQSPGLKGGGGFKVHRARLTSAGGGSLDSQVRPVLMHVPCAPSGLPHPPRALSRALDRRRGRSHRTYRNVNVNPPHERNRSAGRFPANVEHAVVPGLVEQPL